MKKILILAALILPEIMFAKNTSTLASPDGRLTAAVTAGSSVKYSITSFITRALAQKLLESGRNPRMLSMTLLSIARPRCGTGTIR